MGSLVLLTSRIRQTIETSILSQEDVPEVTKREFRQILEDEEGKKDDPPSISFNSVRDLHRIISTGPGSSTKMYLHELLEGADIYHPPLKPPERNPELVARLERLKAEQQDREYRQMTRNVGVKTYGESPLAHVGSEVRSFQKQMFGLLNVVLTIGGAFVFGYMAAAYQSQPIVIRITAGCISAFIVAVADLYFFIKTEV